MNRDLIKGCAAAVLGIATCFLVFGYASYKKVDSTLNVIQKIDKEKVKDMINPNLSQDTKMILNDNWTIALFGIDSRDSSNLSSGNSDVIIIASVNNKTGDIKLASVYRDTCLKTGKDKYAKANSAYAIGGPKKAIEILNENLDLQIDDYVATNWSAVATVINILGGIDIDITEKEFYYINSYITETVNSTGIGSHHLKAAGFNHLDGVQAVAYCRLRYSDNDFKRTERQRLVLSLLLEKVKTSNWNTINNIITTVFPMTSSSIDTSDIISLSRNIFKYNLTQNTGFPFDHKEKRSDSQDFVFPDNLKNNVSKLHQFLYEKENYIPSKAVITISEKIESKYINHSSKVIKKKPEILETVMESQVNLYTKENIESSVSETKTIEIDETESIKDLDVDHYGPGYESMESLKETENSEPVASGPGMIESKID